MELSQIIMYITAFGAALGGLDRLLGNRLGFGEKFEEGFRMLGPVALSMAGIICLAPLLSAVMGRVVGPLCGALRMDPGVFGSTLAIDMGGYQLALDLAADPAMGRFSGIILSAVFGCTVVFTIPVGLAAIEETDRPHFIRGILLGFTAMPAAILAGGLMLGFSLGAVLWNCLPILLISAALAVGVLKKPEAMMRIFQSFAKLVQMLSTLGLTLAAVQYLTGLEIVQGMPSLMEAMETVSAIGIVMLGSMPLAELIQRLLKRPFDYIQKKTGLNGASTTALLLGMVSTTPALAMIPKMDTRGKTVCTASLVSLVALFGAHLAFTMSVEPDMVPALLAAKAVGGILGGAIALYATRDMAPCKTPDPMV